MCQSAVGPQAYWDSYRVARKAHTCCECESIISPGERYQVIEGIWEGKFARYKTCEACEGVRRTATSEGDFNHDEGIALGCLWETVGVEYE